MPEALTSTPPQECPGCGDHLRPNEGFVTWCPACDWNLDPVTVEEPPNRLQRIERRLAVTMGQRQHDLLVGRPLPATGAGAAHVGSVVIAVMIHLVTLALFVLGLVLLIRGWPNLFSIIGGLLAVGAAWLTHPRVGRLSDEALVVDRASTPALHALLERVAGAVGTKAPDVVVLDDDFNAGFGTSGYRRRTILVIGVPLWAALSAQEKVALLGHELGHAVNGDARRGFVVWSALSALREWYVALYPAESPVETISWASAVLMRVLLSPLRGLVRATYALEVKLLMHSGQRAEYLADGMGARAGSSVASVALLDHLLVGESIMNALRRAAIQRDATDLREVVRARVRAVPELEWERLRRVSAVRGHQVDSSHPPTALRRDLLLRRTPDAASVFFSPADEARVEDEISAHVPGIQKRLYEKFTYAW